MIHDVDESLRTLVRREALNGSRVEIGFDAPTREWSARQNTPTVSLYLYDIREDVQRREVNWETVRGPDGIATQHRQPPRRFRLSYLLTCWTQRPEDEHRLLSSLLSCFLRYPVLPEDVLTGSLLETSLPLLTTIALPPPSDRSIADVWSALGGELKPSLDLVVTAPMDTNRPIAAAPPVLEAPFIRVVRPDGSDERPASGSGRHAARSRGPLSHDDPFDPGGDRHRPPGPAAAVAEDDAARRWPCVQGKGKGKKAAEPPVAALDRPAAGPPDHRPRRPPGLMVATQVPATDRTIPARGRGPARSVAALPAGPARGRGGARPGRRRPSPFAGSRIPTTGSGVCTSRSRRSTRCSPGRGRCSIRRLTGRLAGSHRGRRRATPMRPSRRARPSVCVAWLGRSA